MTHRPSIPNATTALQCQSYHSPSCQQTPEGNSGYVPLRRLACYTSASVLVNACLAVVQASASPMAVTGCGEAAIDDCGPDEGIDN